MLRQMMIYIVLSESLYPVEESFHWMLTRIQSLVYQGTYEMLKIQLLLKLHITNKADNPILDVYLLVFIYLLS